MSDKTINDFTLIGIDFWNRPVWRYKNTNKHFCLVQTLVTYKEIKKHIFDILKRINSGKEKLNLLTDEEEPLFGIDLKQIPDNEIKINIDIDMD